jgi:hypothetical protein
VHGRAAQAASMANDPEPTTDFVRKIRQCVRGGRYFVFATQTYQEVKENGL